MTLRCCFRYYATNRVTLKSLPHMNVPACWPASCLSGTMVYVYARASFCPCYRRSRPKEEGAQRMAVSIAPAPERWLQRLDRFVAEVVNLLPDVPMPSFRRERVPTRWILERGPIRASAPVDVLGGFPGALHSTHHFRDTALIVTERYLVIGEGAPDGFAIPIVDVLSAGLIRPSRQANLGLIIHYQDGPDVSSFALNFRGLARGLSGRSRADNVLHQLVKTSVMRERLMHGWDAPPLAMSWDDARRHAAEALVWSGTAMAAVGGWYGSEQRACRIWLTDESLFWSTRDGDGVNRLPLTGILDVRDGVGDRIRVSTRDRAGHRFDLPFDFACCPAGMNSSHQRHRFLNALASRGVAMRAEPVPLAPWQRGSLMRPSDRNRRGSGASAFIPA